MDKGCRLQFLGITVPRTIANITTITTTNIIIKMIFFLKNFINNINNNINLLQRKQKYRLSRNRILYAKEKLEPSLLLRLYFFPKEIFKRKYNFSLINSNLEKTFKNQILKTFIS